MKTGRTLTELAQELDRQASAKKDYLVDSTKLTMSFNDGKHTLMMRNEEKRYRNILGITDIAHQQIATHLGIPMKYYNKMREENPDLLPTNVNSWFNQTPTTRMVRTLDGDARALLSDRYRRIDHAEIMQTVFPILQEMPGIRIESCEVTDAKLYLKVINPRVQADVAVGDVVQSGLLISNSEVGLGSFCVTPLMYRLVCTNGMVVNDSKVRKYHIGRGNESGEDYSLYRNDTLEADDRALMLKVRDTVRAAVDQTHFDRVVAMMRDAKEAKITTRHIPDMIELASSDFNLSKKESSSVLDCLIRNGDFTLYGVANAVTQAAQGVESYDRSTDMEAIGFNVLAMPPAQWKRLNNVKKAG